MNELNDLVAILAQKLIGKPELTLHSRCTEMEAREFLQKIAPGLEPEQHISGNVTWFTVELSNIEICMFYGIRRET